MVTPTRPKHLKPSKHYPQHFFPLLTKKNHEVKSDPCIMYNCFAFAAGIEDARLDHLDRDGYWPPKIPRSPHLATYIMVYQELGFKETDDANYHPNEEKILIYTLQGLAKHAAKMVGVNLFGSKLGGEWDIVHEKNAIGSGIYGNADTYMVRSRSDAELDEANIASEKSI